MGEVIMRNILRNRMSLSLIQFYDYLIEITFTIYSFTSSIRELVKNATINLNTALEDYRTCQSNILKLYYSSKPK